MGGLIAQIHWDDISHAAAFLLGFLVGILVMFRLVHVVGRTLLHLMNGDKGDDK